MLTITEIVVDVDMLPPVANRFVAGETAAEAIDYARQTEDAGVETVINRLGSHHDEYSSARADATAYCRLVDDIISAELDTAASHPCLRRSGTTPSAADRGGRPTERQHGSR